MFLKRFYDDGLAQASYLIGCGATGEAIVIDANRSLAQYRDAAKAEKLAITHVTETHIHADFVSGSRELAKATKAKLLLSGEGGPDWQYGFASSDGAQLLRDGDVISVGNIRLEVMHTPGHTPEHLSFVVVDTAVADVPMGIVTGDFVFVGDVGRPDLLERAAKVANTMEDGARALFRSLERFRALPDFLQVWPGHGAGSACGKSLGAVPTSTVGYEKRFNWGVGTTDEKLFVEMVLAGQPEPPLYFAEMKRINRDGPTLLGALTVPPEGDLAAVDRALAAGAAVVDIRPTAKFGAGHVTGTINIPLNKSFTGWAGWFVRYDQDIHLVGAKADIARAQHELAMIGLERVTGWTDVAALEGAKAAGRALGTVAATTPKAIADRVASGDVVVLDVRNKSEFAAGHIPGALHIPAGLLPSRLAELPRDKPILMNCQGGGRSAIALSVIQKLGVTNATNLKGGFTEWEAGGLAVEKGEGERGKGKGPQ